jgi:hypothetical protein
MKLMKKKDDGVAWDSGQDHLIDSKEMNGLEEMYCHWDFAESITDEKKSTAAKQKYNCENVDSSFKFVTPSTKLLVTSFFEL